MLPAEFPTPPGSVGAGYLRGRGRRDVGETGFRVNAVEVIAALLPGVERSKIDADLRRFGSAGTDAAIEASKWTGVLCIVDRSQVEATLAVALDSLFALLSKADRVSGDLHREANEGALLDEVANFFRWQALEGLGRVRPDLRMVDLNLSADELRRSGIPRWATPKSALGDVLAWLER